jgi:hypothetical protein
LLGTTLSTSFAQCHGMRVFHFSILLSVMQVFKLKIACYNPSAARFSRAEERTLPDPPAALSYRDATREVAIVIFFATVGFRLAKRPRPTSTYCTRMSLP